MTPASRIRKIHRMFYPQMSPINADNNERIFMKFTCDKESIAGNSYAPPILGNGSIATQIDFRGEQRQFSYFRMVPGIYRAGRRYDTRKSELYPHGFFDSISALGEPVFWRETLHCDNAAVTTECSYGNGGSIKTTAFVHWRDNVLAIRKEFEGIDDYRPVGASAAWRLWGCRLATRHRIKECSHRDR